MFFGQRCPPVDRIKNGERWREEGRWEKFRE
jgi:hypothetical protein